MSSELKDNSVCGSEKIFLVGSEDTRINQIQRVEVTEMFSFRLRKGD